MKTDPGYPLNHQNETNERCQIKKCLFGVLVHFEDKKLSNKVFYCGFDRLFS